jgi:hypothetical protein
MGLPAGADLFLAVGVDDEQDALPVALAHRAAEHDEAGLGERVHERGVLVPPGLLAPSARVVPRGTLRALDQVVVGHPGKVRGRTLPALAPWLLSGREASA